MTIANKAARVLGIVLVGFSWTAAACSGNDAKIAPAEVTDGKIAPESAAMKWEQSFPATTEPAHVIRRYTAPRSPGTVRNFYISELERRGWALGPGGDLSYAEWTRDGMQILLIFEPPGADGSEWSVALFAAD